MDERNEFIEAFRTSSSFIQNYETSEIDEDEQIDLSEIFLKKHTPSFRCLSQVELSHSSLHGIDFYFPKPEDPGIDEAFYYRKPDPVPDSIGLEIYIECCKELGIVPIRRVKENLTSEIFNVKYYGITQSQVKCLMEALKVNDYIKHLDLQDNHLDLKSVYYISEMIKTNYTISSINFRECRIGAEGMELIAEALLLNKSLEELDLSFNDLRDEGFEHLVGSITDISSIRKLNLSHNNIGDTAGQTLYDLFEENWSINDLDLSWNKIFMPEVVISMCKALESNETLKKLNLSWNGIGALEAVAALGHCIANNESLESLDLSHNRMKGDEMANCMKKAITHNTSLKHLNLGYNMFNPECAAIIANALLSSENILVLDLTNTWFETSLKLVLRKIKKAGKRLIYSGILENFPKFVEPTKQVLLKRAQYLAENPKKKKYKKNFGHLLLSLTQDSMTEKDFESLLKKNKVKLDSDLKKSIASTWALSKKILNVDQMKQDYLHLYPNTVLPEPPPKKKKSGKHKKKEKSIKQATEVNETKKVASAERVADNQNVGTIEENVAPT